MCPREWVSSIKNGEQNVNVNFFNNETTASHIIIKISNVIVLLLTK